MKKIEFTISGTVTAPEGHEREQARNLVEELATKLFATGADAVAENKFGQAELKLKTSAAPDPKPAKKAEEKAD
ncbi:MAG: hypothetical protein VW338_03520 [Rhodospirillaceae bacterium]